jgi:ribose 5-phosphate isomerase
MSATKSARRWRAWGTVQGTKYIGIVAGQTEAQAIDAALNHENREVSLCHQCSSECEDPEINRVGVEELSAGELADDGE